MRRNARMKKLIVLLALTIALSACGIGEPASQSCADQLAQENFGDESKFKILEVVVTNEVDTTVGFNTFDYKVTVYDHHFELVRDIESYGKCWYDEDKYNKKIAAKAKAEAEAEAAKAKAEADAAETKVRLAIARKKAQKATEEAAAAKALLDAQAREMAANMAKIKAIETAEANRLQAEVLAKKAANLAKQKRAEAEARTARHKALIESEQSCIEKGRSYMPLRENTKWWNYKSKLEKQTVSIAATGDAVKVTNHYYEIGGIHDTTTPKKAVFLCQGGKLIKQ